MQKIITPSDLQGIEIAKKKIYEVVDENTVLFLSGGSTPELLYQTLAKEEKLKAGAVAMVDERYGKKNHQGSNELMIKKTGLLDYFASADIPFFSILDDWTNLRYSVGLSPCAKRYGIAVRKLFSKYAKRVAVLGMGADGHTAGLPAGRVESSKLKVEGYVQSFDDFPGEFKERITLTFYALSQMDFIILLVFGKDKKKALNLMFSKGPIEEIPARFLKTSPISERTLLITDQKI